MHCSSKLAVIEIISTKTTKFDAQPKAPPRFVLLKIRCFCSSNNRHDHRAFINMKDKVVRSQYNRVNYLTTHVFLADKHHPKMHFSNDSVHTLLPQYRISFKTIDIINSAPPPIDSCFHSCVVVYQIYTLVPYSKATTGRKPAFLV